MEIDDKIKDEKLKHDNNNNNNNNNNNKETTKISALSSGKIDKYESFAGKEIVPSN